MFIVLIVNQTFLSVKFFFNVFLIKEFQNIIIIYLIIF